MYVGKFRFFCGRGVKMLMSKYVSSSKNTQEYTTDTQL